MDCSLPGFSVHGILQARILEWYSIGLPFPSPGNLPDAGIEPGSPALEADTLTSEPPGKPVHQKQLPNSGVCAEDTASRSACGRVSGNFKLFLKSSKLFKSKETALKQK